MLKLFGLLLLTVGVPVFADDDVTSGTELIMTLLIHRHGDRTPTESSVSYSTDSETLEALSAPYGYGQLTDEGKRTAYKLGEWIRNRYDELLSERYNKSEIYIRSTESTRAKMTVLTAMAAVYPGSDDNWSDTINWTPTPYTTVPAKYDFNLFELNCPNFLDFFNAAYVTNPSSMDAYADLLSEWSNYVSVNLTEYPIFAYSVNDVYVTEKSFGMSLGDELEELFPEITEAAGAAIDVLLGNSDYTKYQAGVLLYEFFESADALIAGNDTQRVLVYSAHDVNVYSLVAASLVYPRPGVPHYGAALSLELRKVTETGNYVVLPVYLTSPKTGETSYLQVDGCDSPLCDYETFRDITSSNTLDEDTWRSDCGFTDDLSVDASSLD